MTFNSPQLYNLQLIEAWFKLRTKPDEEERRKKKEENYNTVSFVN